MSRHVASSAALKNPQDEGLESEPSVEGASAPASSPRAPNRVRWVTTRKRALATRWEVAGIVLLTALVHGGVAVGAYQKSNEPVVPKKWTKVEVQMDRPPPPAPKAPPPPPPPEPPKAKPQPVKPQPVLEKPVLEPPPPEEPPAPSDTGSDLPSDVDGELWRGSGGLGLAPPAPPAPPKPAAPPPPPPPVIQAREGANFRNNPRPAYPSRAQREGWEGTVLLRIQVLPSGKVGRVTIQKSAGREVLDGAALEKAKSWTFQPATQGGVPVIGWVSVPVTFRLQ